MIPLLIREMLPYERSLVLSAWKKDLWDQKPDWGRALRSEEWWALVNHAIDNITLPSSDVWMACHRDEESVPLAWLVARDLLVIHVHAVASVTDDSELAAIIESSLRTKAPGELLNFNPFMELKKQCRSSR